MATKNEENWMMHYNELKAYVAVLHHFPDKHTSHNDRVRYQRKRIKAVMLPEELAASRHLDEHTYGRRKKI